MRTLFRGDNVTLTSIQENDIPVMEEWFNNTEFLRYYDMVPAMPRSRKQVEKMVDRHEDSDKRCMYAVRTNETGEIIGVIGLDDIIWSNGTAMFYIGIGNNRFTGKGLGREAMSLMLDFAFNELNLYRIHLSVIAYNERAMKLYEGLGFIREGAYREFVNRDGKRYDLYIYGLLRTEWNSGRL